MDCISPNGSLGPTETEVDMVTSLQARTILVLCALVLFPFLLSEVGASPAPAADTTMYLPLVGNDFTVAFEVEHTATSCDGFPCDDFVYGSVTNLTSTPFYSVILEMDVHESSCFPEPPCQDRDF